MEYNSILDDAININDIDPSLRLAYIAVYSVS